MIFLIILTAIILLTANIFTVYFYQSQIKEYFLDQFRPFWWTYPKFTDHRSYTYLTPGIPWRDARNSDYDMPRHCKCEETCPSKVCDEYRERMWHLRECLRRNGKNCYNQFGCHHSKVGNPDNFSLIDPCRTKCKLCPI